MILIMNSPVFKSHLLLFRHQIFQLYNPHRTSQSSIYHLYPSTPDRTSHHLSETVYKCLLEQYLKVCQSVVLMMKRVTALWGVCQAYVRLRGVKAGWLCCDSKRQRLRRLLPPMLPVVWWETHTERPQWWWITELIPLTWETRQCLGREKQCGASVCDNTLVAWVCIGRGLRDVMWSRSLSFLIQL